MQLKIDITTDDDVIVVRVAGELDIHTAPQLRAVTAEACAPGDRVRLLATRLTFVDSTGVAALVALRNRVVTDGGSLDIEDVSDRFRRTLELMNLDTILGIT